MLALTFTVYSGLIVALGPWFSSIIVFGIYFPLKEQTDSSGKEDRLNSGVLVSKGWSDHSKPTPTGCGSFYYQYHGLKCEDQRWPNFVGAKTHLCPAGHTPAQSIRQEVLWIIDKNYTPDSNARVSCCFPISCLGHRPPSATLEC